MKSADEPIREKSSERDALFSFLRPTCPLDRRQIIRSLPKILKLEGYSRLKFAGLPITQGNGFRKMSLPGYVPRQQLPGTLVPVFGHSHSPSMSIKAADALASQRRPRLAFALL